MFGVASDAKTDDGGGEGLQWSVRLPVCSACLSTVKLVGGPWCW